jgi:hypothetical protein
MAQCIMCFRTAEAQQGERSRVLNSGIIILLIPPIVILGGIVWFAWRRNRQQCREKAVPSSNEYVDAVFTADSRPTQTLDEA